MSNNSNPPSIFKSTEALQNRQRKQSVEGKPSPQNLARQSEAQKVVSDLDISQSEDAAKNNEQMQSAFVDNSYVMPNKPPKSVSSSSSKKKTVSQNCMNQENKKKAEKQIRQQNRFSSWQHRQQNEQSFKSESLAINPSIDWKALWQYIKLVLFSYEFNLVDYLRSIDSVLIEQVIELLKIAPGHKPIQYVYSFYTFKYGVVVGVMAAMLYPLPYSILFLMIPVDLEVPFVAFFMLAGMRSGAIALLLKYCLHFPKQTFHWIVFIFTVITGILIPSNYIYLMIFGISIFLSFYISRQRSRGSFSSDSRQSESSGYVGQSMLNISTFGNNYNQEQIYKYYKVIDGLPNTHPKASIAILSFTMIFLWILQRYFENRELSIFQQVVPVSLLASSKEMLAFFPYIYMQSTGKSTLSPNTLMSLSFLFPGPHSKAFMFFIIHSQIKNDIIGYICLYLPSILLTNIFIGYRPYFYTSTYYNIRQSIQAVGNGIVICLVYWMLDNQGCFLTCVCYSAVVIVVVAKLYKLRQLFAITLGIILISIRSIILNVNKGISFEEQACLSSRGM